MGMWPHNHSVRRFEKQIPQNICDYLPKIKKATTTTTTWRCSSFWRQGWNRRMTNWVPPCRLGSAPAFARGMWGVTTAATCHFLPAGLNGFLGTRTMYVMLRLTRVVSSTINTESTQETYVECQVSGERLQRFTSWPPCPHNTWESIWWSTGQKLWTFILQFSEEDPTSS